MSDEAGFNNMGGRTMLEAGDSVRLRVRNRDTEHLVNVASFVKYTGNGGLRAELVVCPANDEYLVKAVRDVFPDPRLARLTAVAEAARALHGKTDIFEAHEEWSALGAALEALDGGDRG